MANPYGMGMHNFPAPKPDNYLVWTILATLLCCLPLGAVGIYFSTQVDSCYSRGDLAGALDASNKAKNLAIISALTPVVGFIFYLVVIVGITGWSLSLNFNG